MSDLMAERYGVGSPRRRRVALGAVALFIVALLGWLGWSAWDQATKTVAGTISAFDVVSAHRIKVTVEIHRPGGSTARCTLRAQASDHSVVGELVVSVPAGGESDVQIQTAIRTDREATSADVTTCY